MLTDRQISADFLLKVVGIIFAFVGQAFAIYTSVTAKIDDVATQNALLKDRIIEVEKKLIERQQYIDKVEKIEKSIKDIETQMSEMSFQNLNTFKRSIELENDVRKFIDKGKTPERK